MQLRSGKIIGEKQSIVLVPMLHNVTINAEPYPTLYNLFIKVQMPILEKLFPYMKTNELFTLSAQMWAPIRDSIR